jgi:hypothetical protein
MLKKLIIDFTPAAVVQDVKTILSEEKFKRNDKSREVVSILTASMSGPTVEKCKAKVDLETFIHASVEVHILVSLLPGICSFYCRN